MRSNEHQYPSPGSSPGVSVAPSRPSETLFFEEDILPAALARKMVSRASRAVRRSRIALFTQNVSPSEMQQLKRESSAIRASLRQFARYHKLPSLILYPEAWDEVVAAVEGKASPLLWEWRMFMGFPFESGMDSVFIEAFEARWLIQIDESDIEADESDEPGQPLTSPESVLDELDGLDINASKPADKKTGEKTVAARSVGRRYQASRSLRSSQEGICW